MYQDLLMQYSLVIQWGKKRHAVQYDKVNDGLKSKCSRLTLQMLVVTTMHWDIFSSADDVSSAELMVLLIVRRPSLLLLQFLFENSEFFTGETRHIVPPCNKAGISNFCLEFQKLQKFQIS